MGDEEREPVYYFCNSCGENYDDEVPECETEGCIDGEIEPAYDD